MSSMLVHFCEVRKSEGGASDRPSLGKFETAHHRGMMTADVRWPEAVRRIAGADAAPSASLASESTTTLPPTLARR